MFIARQPIFNKNKTVYGYELLFRDNYSSSFYKGNSSESSTAFVLGGLFELGLNRLVGNKKAFINFDYNFLLSDSIELIEPHKLVIEVLENTNIDDKLLQRIKQLKEEGYKIALDDFVSNMTHYSIIPMANIIKYDILLTPLSEIEEEVKEFLKQKKILLAEKIETEEDFIKAKNMGFRLFQGYFFSKPSIVDGIKGGGKSDITLYQRLLNELHKKEPSFNKLTDIVKTDVNMTYRLIKAMNNKKGLKEQRIVKMALIRMGFLKLERWIHILMLQELSSKKPKELTFMSLIRSRFGEYIAEQSSRFRRRRYDISLMCLFSMLDGVLNVSMEEALKDIYISSDIKDALIKRKGPFEPILKLVESYEKGEWEKTMLISENLNVNIDILSKNYIDSIYWARCVLEN